MPTMTIYPVATRSLQYILYNNIKDEDGNSTLRVNYGAGEKRYHYVPCFLFSDYTVFLNNIRLTSATVIIRTTSVDRFTSATTANLAVFSGRINSDISAYDLYNANVGRTINTYSTLTAGNDIRVSITDKAILNEILRGGFKITLNNPVEGQAYFGGRLNSVVAARPRIELSFEYDYRTPEVVALEPSHTVVDGNIANTFKWAFSQEINAAQGFVDIDQYNAGVWSRVVNKQIEARQEIVVQGGDILSGTSAWRVRAYLENGTTVSDWSEAPIIVVASPPAPTILYSPTNPRPKFTWGASQQSGYQVRLGDYESPVIYGVDRTWTAPFIVPDGEIEFSVRVINDQSMWSEWASVVVNIQNQPMEDITLYLQATCKQSMTLNWETSGEYEAFYILRDGEPIAKTTDHSYTDYMSIGKVTYTVRGVRGEYYTDSNPMTGTVKIKNAVIVPIGDNIEWLKLEKKVNDRPEHSRNSTANVVFKHYEGREKPEAYTNGQKDYEHSMAFTYRTEAEYRKLLDMLGKKVIYKDCMGAKAIGVLHSINGNEVRYYDFNFSITETDYKEVIAYD